MLHTEQVKRKRAPKWTEDECIFLLQKYEPVRSECYETARNGGDRARAWTAFVSQLTEQSNEYRLQLQLMHPEKAAKPFTRSSQAVMKKVTQLQSKYVGIINKNCSGNAPLAEQETDLFKVRTAVKLFVLQSRRQRCQVMQAMDEAFGPDAPVYPEFRVDSRQTNFNNFNCSEYPLCHTQAQSQTFVETSDHYAGTAAPEDEPSLSTDTDEELEEVNSLPACRAPPALAPTSTVPVPAPASRRPFTPSATNASPNAPRQ